MNIGIGGMGGLQIGKENRHLGIGTTIGMTMRMMIALGIDEGGQVTVRDREAESLPPPKSHLAIPVPVQNLHRPYNSLPRWTDILKSPMILGLTLRLYRLPRSLRLVSSITPSLKVGMQCWSSFAFAEKIKKKRGDLIAWDCRRRN